MPRRTMCRSKSIVKTNYSKDKNLWHLSHEGLDLEDPANEPQYAETEGFWNWASRPCRRRHTHLYNPSF